MVSDVDVARWRLRSQHLAGRGLPTAAGVVSSLLAVQAENPSQSAWAVATRTAAPDPGDLAAALDDGRVLRTHVLRPTWHYVAADDLVWLVEVTAPGARRPITQQLRSSYDDAALDRLADLVLDGLAGTHLTRLLMGHLELRAEVCSGPPVDGTHSYALVADRVPPRPRLDRDEALAELGLRYATGHGPVVAEDLAYWATLTLTDARKGLTAAADRLERFDHDGRTYWHAPGEEPPVGPLDPAAHLLQILDETYRGYGTATRWVLDAAGAVPRQRESAIGMALVDGQLVAPMKRTLTARQVVFELAPYASWSDDHRVPVERAAARYGASLGLERVLDLR